MCAAVTASQPATVTVTATNSTPWATAQDADGICDDVDDCVGELDACGVCNGPGEIYECGCSDSQPATSQTCDDDVDDPTPWACDIPAMPGCDDVDDALLARSPRMNASCDDRMSAVFDCTVDADADGICDDIDDCVGELDACGVCNGPGEIYECGCSDIPAGDCDCDGNQLDALGVCGGDCAADADADGICDDVDDCVGALDACGCATAQVRSTNADVLTSLLATAIAMATKKTPWACVVVTALRTPMPMASVTT